MKIINESKNEYTASNKIRRSKNWITTSITHSIKIRNNLHKKIKKNLNDIEIQQKYKMHRKFVEKFIKDGKKQFFSNKL